MALRHKRCWMARSTHCWRYRYLSLWRRRGPRLVGEVEEVQQVRLGRVAFGQRWQVEALLQEMRYGGMVHGGVAYVVLFHERRNDEGGNTEANLRREP